MKPGKKMETVLRRLSGESSISGVPQHGKIDMRKMRPRCAWPHWLCRAGQSFFRFCTADRCGMTAPIGCPSGYTEIDLTEKMSQVASTPVHGSRSTKWPGPACAKKQTSSLPTVCQSWGQPSAFGPAGGSHWRVYGSRQSCFHFTDVSFFLLTGRRNLGKSKNDPLHQKI